MTTPQEDSYGAISRWVHWDPAKRIDGYLILGATAVVPLDNYSCKSCLPNSVI